MAAKEVKTEDETRKPVIEAWKATEVRLGKSKGCDAIDKEVKRLKDAGMTPETAICISLATDHIHVMEALAPLLNTAQLLEVSVQASGGIKLIAQEQLLLRADFVEKDALGMLMKGKIQHILTGKVFERLDDSQLQEVLKDSDKIAKKLSFSVETVKAEAFRAVKDANLLAIHLVGEQDSSMQDIIKTRIKTLDKEGK